MLWGVAIVLELSVLGRLSLEERFDAKLAVDSFIVAEEAFTQVSRFWAKAVVSRPGASC